VQKHNKPCPHAVHRGIARFLGIDQNVIRSSHGHSTPYLKISCKSVQRFARNVADKEISIAASRGFSELTQNWIRSSHGHSVPSLKILCKSVQPFSRNLANKETNKYINKQRNRSKTIPCPPMYRGRGKKYECTMDPEGGVSSSCKSRFSLSPSK